MRFKLHFVASLVLAACGSGPDATLYVEDAASIIDDFRGDVARGDTATDAGGRDGSSRDSGTDAAPRDVGGDSGGGTDTGADASPDAVVDTGYGPACAEIDTALDFGTRIGGQIHEEVLWIDNCGDLETDDVVISAIAFVNDAVITSAPEFHFAEEPTVPIVIPPFDRWPLQIRYRSDIAGSHTAVIRLTTNDPNHATVDIALSAQVL